MAQGELVAAGRHRRRGEAGVIGYQLCGQPVEIERIYAMRKKAVGLLGNSKGAVKPIPFAEDTCVPPRPDIWRIISLNSWHCSITISSVTACSAMWTLACCCMCDPTQEALMKQLSDRIVALT